MTENKTWPSEIRLSKDRRTLIVSFESGETFELAAEYLRVSSPSAEVQGHTPDQRKTVPGKRNVAIIGVDPVGTYAVRLTFDDTHDSGLFTWDYLFELGRDHGRRWRDYLEELATKGLGRG
ncbi:gamma-butyrobetaine hydroxylase-like domain-containing protein [Methylobrevis pamukkalensis]|uniref:Gamma-butyrobetaine hydroxylase-like N-terminal domain-containing protein n=1 Tax=Methylobrevis pamukkalensis TaxID=1439726 RepID=A0A1E3GQT5_9HYPH|nr:DUF971 domain-containing protein [Methylobrevis pamukkalensis]ODN66295.1 hypothetical protein A6302_04448 [Methylobrevis pamukkalensis]